jgi:hypothetical protein
LTIWTLANEKLHYDHEVYFCLLDWNLGSSVIKSIFVLEGLLTKLIQAVHDKDQVGLVKVSCFLVCSACSHAHDALIPIQIEFFFR